MTTQEAALQETPKKYVLAIDQGTTSSRAIVFDHSGKIISVGQLEHEQIFPKAGWVEHDPMEIWRNVREAVGQALSRGELNRHEIAAVGITNQRETAVVWDKNTGEPVYNAIVWQDTRTQKICDRLAGDEGPDKYKSVCGLPLATYFSGPKVAWILENVEGARERAEAGDLLFGTTDSWVLWNLTGGVHGGVHLTDVTNASRTMLMDYRSLKWDESICADMGIPMSMLPEIRSSSEVYGYGRPQGLLVNTPIAGILGDQQAATFGQACFEPGMAKNTYGTGCFMLINTGTKPVNSENGLLTTLCYKIGDEPAVYALEGSVAVAGSLVQWLRDNMGLISSAEQVEELAATVEDNGGAYIVPAFSGLFAPHWRPEARGVFAGLTRYVNKGHIARAALEATAYQTREVMDAMIADAQAHNVELSELKVDGGMTANSTLMQFQSDMLGVPVVLPSVAETTALGAAYAAGIAVGFWSGEKEVAANWSEGQRWEPQMPAEERERLLRNWKKAVSRTLDWVDDDTE
ncbi:glycerol kinase GlpK [Dermatophilus congolensis]|uniref:glycerol kinase GlpK n=1 Tax=Dermatophilus congolensis TaxID=1863 RepID=UPI001AB00F89|nr:glycerol kinase GlpK [Dermatophilus congolensis]MBO3128761.1 glycerol kinase GlpK [Dermatophilus congolensis]MBO3132603.1 glycerol kinase GlpK [Dermatophilus congolensis]MBO3133235.1 glycerol kinase GlpK [Dermatophilus congolensis]MBO3135471.1 glycerol kinase GlpK [Dermatophilus congolensis]MBO3137710.1 glycerol kinase GlpK [Dermatophilus congolensis]